MKKRQGKVRPERVYWDSSCFIAWLKPEPDRKDRCREVLEAATRGELEIVTSLLTFVEVVKGEKGPMQIDRRKADMIRDFLKQPWIIAIQLDRRLAEDARELLWKYGLKPRDSVHLATALSAISRGGLREMHTFDDHFLKLSIEGLHIREPQAFQYLIPDTGDDQDGADDQPN